MNDLDRIDAKLDTIIEAIARTNDRIDILLSADDATAGLAKLVMAEMGMLGEDRAIEPEPTPCDEGGKPFLDWRDMGPWFEITYDGNEWMRADADQTALIRKMTHGRKR